MGCTQGKSKPQIQQQNELKKTNLPSKSYQPLYQKNKQNLSPCKTNEQFQKQSSSSVPFGNSKQNYMNSPIKQYTFNKDYIDEDVVNEENVADFSIGLSFNMKIMVG